MALTNFSELKSSIADFLNRDDLTSVIPTFISLAEAQFARDLRHYKMENRATGTIDSQYMTKPSDWLRDYPHTPNKQQYTRVRPCRCSDNG